MMCHNIGFPPISTIGFGILTVASLNLDPKPPAKITAFISFLFQNYSYSLQIQPINKSSDLQICSTMTFILHKGFSLGKRSLIGHKCTKNKNNSKVLFHIKVN